MSYMFRSTLEQAIDELDGAVKKYSTTTVADFVKESTASLEQGRLSLFEFEVALAATHEKSGDKLWMRNRMLLLQKKVRSWQLDIDGGAPAAKGIFRAALKV